MKRRGRKRSAGQREPNGRLASKAKRASKPTRAPGGALPLDVLAARGWLTDREAAAGRIYAALDSRFLTGGPVCQTTRYAIVHHAAEAYGWTAHGRPLDDETAEARYIAAAAALAQAGGNAVKSVRSIAVHGETPSWLRYASPADAPRGERRNRDRDLPALRRGLGAIWAALRVGVERPHARRIGPALPPHGNGPMVFAEGRTMAAAG